MSREEMAELFAPYGTITDTYVPIDRETGRARGFGFVTFDTAEAGQAAIDALHGTEFDGRTLTVNQAQERAPRPGGDRGGDRGGFRGGDRGPRPMREDRAPRHEAPVREEAAPEMDAADDFDQD